MKVKYENSFDWFENDEKSRVFQIIPDCYPDKRGYFMEVFKDISGGNAEVPEWIKSLKWIRQINRSSSVGGVVRGCHAQKKPFCQGKMVEAITEKIYDIITDARPDSKTFGVSVIFTLDPEIHNKLWVPRGFLHSFAVPFSCKGSAVFEYYCDNVYDHSSEICVNASTVLPNVVDRFKEIMDGVGDLKYGDLYDLFLCASDNVYSEKDSSAEGYETFMYRIKEEYDNSGLLWYK